MKRLLAVIIIMTAVAALSGCRNADVPAIAPDDGTPAAHITATPGAVSEPHTPKGPSGEIIYGSGVMIHNVFHPFFPGGNNAVNNDIRLLTSGLYTYERTREETFTLNPTVVLNETITDGTDGSKTYRFEIHDDLFFSDGTPVTAEHYVFGILLYSSYEFGMLGAYNTRHSELAGWEAYSSGHLKTFSGVRLHGMYEYSVTIAAENLPFYYESYAVSAAPEPMHVYAPGVNVIDSDDGAMLSAAFTEELLRSTILGGDSGLLFHPKVFSGAYMLTSYDLTTGSAVLEFNPYFKGNYDGSKPAIARITIIFTPPFNRMDKLAAGEVDILSGVGGAESGVGIEMSGTPGSELQYTVYPRAGYGKIHFRHDFGPTRYLSVRRAVAYCFDREEFTKQLTNDTGIIIHGFYGASTREYLENINEIDSLLDRYPFGIDRAVEVLTEDGWVYNAEGGRYIEGSGLPRYKIVHGMPEPLVIRWYSVADSPAAALIRALLMPEAAKAGIIIEETMGDFSTLTQHLNSHDGEFHMFNFAADFTSVSYKWLYYGTDDASMGAYNNNFIRDPELERLALEMRETTSGSFDEWSEKWVVFQIYWNSILPDIPVYSDLYHDFYPADLQNYTVTPLWSWANAIQYANFRSSES